MARVLKITKDYSDVAERNIFIAERQEASPQIKDALSRAVSAATMKICAVLESGITDDLMRILLENEIARKYIVVPEVNEDKLKNFASKAIIREVPSIKGNYIIIDEKSLFIFNEAMDGVSVNEASAVKVVCQIFMHEFWGDEARFEMIDRREPSAEITFNLPPVYGNDSVLLDFSQSDSTAIENLILTGDEYGFVDGVSVALGSSKMIIKTTKSNKAFLEKTNNEDIILAPALPISFIRRGQEVFVLNFDIAKYAVLPERKKGRLFAVKCKGAISLGQVFRFAKHKTRKELLGTQLLDLDEQAVEIQQTANEERTISVDLSLASEYAKMPQDTLEARLDAQYCDLLYSDKKACSITFNIALAIARHKIQKQADIYRTYADFNKEIGKKAQEVAGSAEAIGLSDLQAAVLLNGALTGNLSTVASCREALGVVNGWVDEYTQQAAEKSKTDESLLEVKSSGKKKNKNKKPRVPTVAKLSIKIPTADVPMHGMLYQDGGRYEYVLKSSDGAGAEQSLQSAQGEMEAMGITGTTYHLE